MTSQESIGLHIALERDCEDPLTGLQITRKGLLPARPLQYQLTFSAPVSASCWCRCVEGVIGAT